MVLQLVTFYLLFIYYFNYSTACQPRLAHEPTPAKTPVVGFIFLLGLLADDKVGLVGSQLLNPDFLLYCPSCKRVDK